MSQFNNVFSLLESEEFQESFKFIYDILCGYTHRFYVIPGRNEKVTLDIKINIEDEAIIKTICLDGNNILKLENGIEEKEFHDNPRYYPLSLDRLKNRLSEALVIPKHLLDLKFVNGTVSDTTVYLFPRSHTLEK